jgi:hypothetical protein
MLVAALAGAMMPVAAQTQAPQPLPPPRYARPRIEIAPRPLLYRRCVDWYELQNRPSGTVLYPQMRCWWVRG